LTLKRYPEALRELNAAIASHPHDLAAAQYQLAAAYDAAGDASRALDAVLACLENAPSYPPALRLLLKLKDPKP
jgi:cellulose synthase operon protein C